MEMINIINKNKARKQRLNRQNELKRLAKREKISNIIALFGYILGAVLFAQIVTLLVK